MEYDLIILGGGPAGYVAAIDAGKAGKSVLVIEEAHEGGVCLNAGCIPTKTLLHISKQYHHMVSGDVPGIGSVEPKMDLKAIQKWREEVINRYRAGILSLFKQSKVEMVNARGKLIDRSTVVADGKKYRASSIMIATGSSPVVPPIPGIEGNGYVCTSSELLEVEALPEHLCVIGGGVIGLEFASMFSGFGCRVTVIEMLDGIAPMAEPEVRKAMMQNFRDFDIRVSTRVTGIDGNTITMVNKKGEEESLSADRILLSVGRRPNIEGIGLKEAGVKTSKGAILVNERMETSAPRVYAIGDVIGKSLLAHSASRMAEIAVKVLLGDRTAQMRYDAIPWAIYTQPEAAGCGMTEKEAKDAGIKVRKAVVPLGISARFFAENPETRGLVKIIIDAEDKRILGMQMIGSSCSEMIWGMTMAVTLGLTTDEVTQTIFAHPTVSEVIRDALLHLG